jgi:hypothetical protein
MTCGACPIYRQSFSTVEDPTPDSSLTKATGCERVSSFFFESRHPLDKHPVAGSLPLELGFLESIFSPPNYLKKVVATKYMCAVVLNH